MRRDTPATNGLKKGIKCDLCKMTHWVLYYPEPGEPLYLPDHPDQPLCYRCLIRLEDTWVKNTPQPDLLIATNYDWYSPLTEKLYRRRLAGM